MATKIKTLLVFGFITVAVGAAVVAPISIGENGEIVSLSVAHAVCIKTGGWLGIGGLGTCTLADLEPACRNEGKCNSSDSAILAALVSCSDPVNNCNDAQKADSAEAKKIYQKSVTLVTCTGKFDYISNPFTCLMRWGFSWIGAAFIWLGVKLAVITGSLFESALQYTVVGFGKYMQYLKPGIDVGWAVLRDLANIVIIGMFVFIAVNIILGVKEFGDKKKVAQVLVVAVLINFSLLFTKVIVDASNFTAYQFYNSMVKGVQAQSVTVAGQEITSSVITSRFMQLLGVEGFADSGEKLNKIAESNNNALYALGYGILSFIFLAALAAVFLYGAFLIISRAVLLVFLMLTSALAFASWLIPQQLVEKGFQKWWESLLRVAFFAPLLVAFLWMTLMVSIKLEAALQGSSGKQMGTLGALAENASTEANVLALLNFTIILGLLFASFVTANAFSKSVAGFNFARGLIGGAALLPLGIASRLTGLLGRQTIGRYAARRSLALDDRINRA